MKKFNHASAAVLAVVFVFGLAGLIKAATTVNLGTDDNFAVVAGSTITNTGASVITGDLGLSPGTSVTGFPPGTLGGNQYVNNAVAVQAQNDLTTAYNAAAGQAPATVATQLGGTTKSAGVYNSADGTFGITGTLTLDGQGDPNAVFIFKTASTLITGGSSVVSLTNGAQACNVFWQVGSSATLGTNSVFKGNILALTSVTLTTGANVEGRVLARNGAVTLDTNTVAKAVCVSPPPAPPAPPAPTPATLHVIKQVINIGGGTASTSSFNLHVKFSGTDVSGSPASGTGAPGTSYSLAAGSYVVSEDANAAYVKSYSGDCDSVGSVTLAAGNDKTCTVINTFIPPTPVPVVVISSSTIVVAKPVVNDVVTPPVVIVAPLVVETPVLEPVADAIKTPTAVAVPKLPNTGLPPEAENNSGKIMLLVGALSLVALPLLLILKKRQN